MVDKRKREREESELQPATHSQPLQEQEEINPVSLVHEDSTEEEEAEVDESSDEDEDADEEEEDDENYEETPNDLSEVFSKWSDSAFIFKLTLGLNTVEELKPFVDTMGRVLINLGDGLTLLHIAAQYGRDDWMDYFIDSCQHPLECQTVHGETPLDQASWRGHIDAAMKLIR